MGMSQCRGPRGKTKVTLCTRTGWPSQREKSGSSLSRFTPQGMGGVR